MNEFSRIETGVVNLATSSEDERAARFLVKHGITSDSLRATAREYPECAPFCLRMAPLVHALTPARLRIVETLQEVLERGGLGEPLKGRGAATTMHVVPPASGD